MKNQNALRTTPQRSALMSRIPAKNTKPELTVRSVLHRLGYRFRVHVRDLPGCPDIVLPKHKTVFQVKGCFWHLHTCSHGKIPGRNQYYWGPKLRGNVKRDKKNERALRRNGWSVHTLWECRVNAYSNAALSSQLLERLKRARHKSCFRETASDCNIQ